MVAGSCWKKYNRIQNRKQKQIAEEIPDKRTSATKSKTILRLPGTQPLRSGAKAVGPGRAQG